MSAAQQNGRMASYALVGWPLPLPGVLVNSGGLFELVFHAPGTWAPGEHRVFCGGACHGVTVVIGGVAQELRPGGTQTFTIEEAQEGLDVRVRGGGGETPSNCPANPTLA